MWRALGLALAMLAGVAAAAPTRIATVDLGKTFATRTPWTFTADQGPSVEGILGDPEPGVVTICLRGGAATCDPVLATELRPGEMQGDLFDQPHFLTDARVVGTQPLLWVQTASVHSGDGDQVVLTQVLAYQRASDRFTRVFRFVTGRNNNQDVRYITAGPLAGAIVSAAPTDNAPYGFWVIVNKPGKTGVYAQALRFRSATHYGDGNPLGVIDSEMTNIESRLGLWKPGAPPVLPAKGCAQPRLVKMELWCGPAPASP
jgi:hypothetical protein